MAGEKGSQGPHSRRRIHSDLERGFIRAEVFKYDELMELGSEAELKKSGKFMWRARITWSGTGIF